MYFRELLCKVHSCGCFYFVLFCYIVDFLQQNLSQCILLPLLTQHLQILFSDKFKIWAQTEALPPSCT